MCKPTFLLSFPESEILLLGSSLVQNGLNPEVMMEQFEKQLGRPLPTPDNIDVREVHQSEKDQFADVLSPQPIRCLPSDRPRR